MAEKPLSDINFQPKTDGFSYKQKPEKVKYLKKLIFLRNGLKKIQKF